MPKVPLPAVQDDLAEGRFSRALSAINVALEEERSGDESLLGRYRLLLLRKIGALPQIDVSAVTRDVAPPPDPEAPWLENERAWVILHYQPAKALDLFGDLRQRAPSRLDVALGEAAALRSLQRATKSRALLEDLRSQHGKTLEWRLAAAQLDVDEGRFQEALDQLDRVISKAPHHEGALAWKVLCLRDMGRQEQAQSVLDQHAACCPKSILLRIPQGWLRFDRGDWDGALREFDSVLGLGCRYPAAVVGKVMVLRNRRTDQDISMAQDLLRSSDSDPPDPDVAIQAGWFAFDSHDYETAVAAFDRALRAHPYEPNAVVGKAQAFQQQGLFDKAQQTLKEAIEAVPESRRFKHELGWLYIAGGKYGKAAACFIDIRKDNYADAPATHGLATAYHFAGRYDDAEEELRRSLRLVPGDAALRTEFGWILILRGHYSAAIAEFDWALKINRAFEGAVQGKFTALSRLEKYDKIRTLLAEFEQVRHEGAALDVMRGQAAFAQGRYDEALEAFQEALARYHRHIDALVGRIATLRTLGRFAESKAAHAAAMREFPGETRLIIEEAWLHFDLGEYDQALGCFERADPTEDALRGEAAVLRKRSEYGKAARLVDEGLAYLPGSLPLLTERAWIFFDEERYPESCRAFQGVLKISIEHREARQGMVASLIQLLEYEQAHQVLATAIRQQPESPLFRTEEGYLLLEQNRLEEAKTAFSRARGVSPHDENAVVGESIALRRMKRHEEALRLLDEELSNHGENPALRSEQGWVLLDQGNAIASIVAFGRARTLLPANDSAVLGNAIALRRLGRRDEARELLVQQIQPEVSGGALEAQLAWVYLESGRWEEATAIFHKIAEQDHKYREEARLGIAEAAVRRGDRDQAILEYEQLVRDLPSSAIAKMRLATQLSDQRRARQLCLEAIRIDPRLAMAYDRLGITSMWLGEAEAAEAYLRQSLALDPSRSIGLIRLGWFYLQTSRLDEAQQSLTAAIAQEPSDPDANILMGAVYLRTGAIDQADLHFSRALQAKPKDPVAIEGKARALIAVRDWGRAEEVLRGGLEHTPDTYHRDLHLLLARALIARGDETRSPHFYEAALTEARAAMAHAEPHLQRTGHDKQERMVTGDSPESAARESGEPWFLAAVASYRLSARSRAEGRAVGAIPRRDSHERLAIEFLRICLKHNPRHREAIHHLALLDDQGPLNSQALGQWGIMTVAIALLVTLWAAFLASNRVSENTVVILSPVLVGLLVIASLLPFLERFKLPGVEADVRSPSSDLASPLPLTDVSLGQLAAESLSPGTERTTLPTAPQAPGNVRRSAAISISALAGKPRMAEQHKD